MSSFDPKLPNLELLEYQFKHILNKDILLEPALVSQYIESHHITHASFTTRFGVELLEHYELPLKLVALGGERLDVLPNSKVKLFNVYGPTEFTIISTYAEVENIDNYWTHFPNHPDNY